MENRKHMEAIIERTFGIIKEVYKCRKEVDGENDKLLNFSETRIIFPKYSTGETRVSEQELKQIFIEQLNVEIGKGWDVYYSVETPTKDIYRFSDVKEPLCGKELEESILSGQSANFDLVIHDNQFKRIALVEFKSNNPDSKDYVKDFKKLNNEKEKDENDILRYFIQIVKNTDSGTFSNLHKKIQGNEDIYYCCSLTTGDITKDVISASIKK